MARIRWLSACRSAKWPQCRFAARLAGVALALGCSSGQGMDAADVASMRAGDGAAGAASDRPAPVNGANSANGASGANGANGANGTNGTNGANGANGANNGPAAGAPAGSPTPLAPADGSGGAARGTGPGDWDAGDYPPDLMAETYLEIRGVPGQQDLVREYKVHVPRGYDPELPAPAVFCIHGLLQTAARFCAAATGMPQKSDEAGFILIMPNGYNNSWNGGSCCGDASSMQLDDVALFRAILEQVGQHVNLDLDRVYATGLSNGGYMSFRLACDAADLFTAVAPAAGAVGTSEIGGGTNSLSSDLTDCMPSRPVSVLAVHGTADPLIAYALHKPSLNLIAAGNGCATHTQPAAAPASAGDTRCESHDGCPSGIELTGCTVEGGGHCWFGSPDCGTGGGDIGLAIVGKNSDTMRNTEAVWDFFARHSR